MMGAVAVEKRASPRQKVFKHGVLAFSGGGAIDCTVRNISLTGARIDVANLVSLPDAFTLLIESDRFMRRCRPVWRTDDKIGLAFV